MKSREFANFFDWAEIESDEGSMSQEWHNVSQTGSTVPNSLKFPVYNGHFYEFNVSLKLADSTQAQGGGHGVESDAPAASCRFFDAWSIVYGGATLCCPT